VASGLSELLQLFWSPDAARIYFVDMNMALSSVGALGGTVRHEMNDVLASDISPDGRTVAAWKSDPAGKKSALWIGPLGGG
jgi:hypothetical protein